MLKETSAKAVGRGGMGDRKLKDMVGKEVEKMGRGEDGKE